VGTHFAACLLTGQEADLDGVCVEHGETACVMTVEVATPASKRAGSRFPVNLRTPRLAG